MRTVLLSSSEIAALMAPADYLDAGEHAFRASKEGRAASPAPLHIHGKHGGGFHGKGASLDGARNYVALKFNGNFPGNPGRAGLPTIQGALLLCDADNGSVLAIMDSIEITLRRTAAASALAANYLARAGSETLAIIGCGDQAAPQAEAIAALFPLKRGLCFDADDAKTAAFAAHHSQKFGFPFRAAQSVTEATCKADIVVTCTTSRTAFLGVDDVKRGAFIAAVGADNPEKSEIEPSLMRHARVVVDSLDQCAIMGDLHRAIKAGALTREDVYAELGDMVIGKQHGRENDRDTFVFDSTGTALQDVASAARVYERACERGRGQSFSLA